jgi:prepilin-type processing-associated H-X9-DG protein
LVELLVAIAIIAVLAALLLPTLSKAKAAAQSAGCLANLKQLQAGYIMYADDNGDRQPPDKAEPDPSGGVRNLPGSWVAGNAKTDTNSAGIESGVLSPYIGAAETYHCPADKSKVRNASGVSRARSYSLDGWLISSDSFYDGNGLSFTAQGYAWGPFFLTAHQFPGPSSVFAFIDEHEQSIDSGFFLILQPQWLDSSPASLTWRSLPADRHRQGANLSFLDGHADPWRWKAAKTYKGFGQVAAAGADTEDHTRLQEALPHDPMR